MRTLARRLRGIHPARATALLALALLLPIGPAGCGSTFGRWLRGVGDNSGFLDMGKGVYKLFSTVFKIQSGNLGAFFPDLEEKDKEVVHRVVMNPDDRKALAMLASLQESNASNPGYAGIADRAQDLGRRVKTIQQSGDAFIQQAYAFAPETPLATDPAMEIEFEILKETRDDQGRVLAQSVADGDMVLAPALDAQGFDVPGTGENYKCVFSVSERAYVYLVQVDSVGKADVLWPRNPAAATDDKWDLSRGENPVEAHRIYEVPGDGKWFYLDQNEGVETLFLMVSPEPRTPQETSALQEFERATFEFARVSNDTGGDVPLFSSPTKAIDFGSKLATERDAEVVGFLERGVKGTRLSTQTQTVSGSADGARHQFQPRLWEGKGRMVVRRWFRHVNDTPPGGGPAPVPPALSDPS